MIRPAGLVLLLLAVSRLARADGPVTDRRYTIDAYRGAAVADYRVVGMGGASLATAEGAIGLLGNPAAAASRPATASSWFYWDFLFDVYTPALAVDYDNSGMRQDQAIGKTGALNAGLLGMFGAWGTAIAVAGEVRNFTLPGGTEATLSSAIWRLTLARSFAAGEWIAGASLVGGGFNLRLPASGVELVNAADWSIEAGGLWRPPESNLRIGASFRPTMKPRIEGAACDPNNCFGYHPDISLEWGMRHCGATAAPQAVLPVHRQGCAVPAFFAWHGACCRLAHAWTRNHVPAARSTPSPGSLADCGGSLMATISVLSIDGGGIRGMIPAAFLNRLEQRTGHRVSELFDYLAGTSTGGILALGLGANRPGCNSPYTAEQLVRLYKTEGRRIFSRSLLHFARALDNLNGPRFPEYGIDEVLKRYFGDTRLKDARTNVFVSAYAIERRRPFFFRSWQAKAPATRRTHDFPVWEVARSTSAAPTFFPPFKATAADGKSYALIDGGVYANNPALCAWVEARDRHPRDEILVVSLGTGNENRAVDFHRAKRWGRAGWARPLIDVIFDGVSDTVHVQLDEMLNPGDARKYFRFQQDIPPAQQALDNTSAENLTLLRRIGETMARGKEFDDLCAQLGAIAAERAVLNQVA